MGLFDFFKKKTISNHQEDNDTFDMKRLKEEFFVLMKPYYEAGMVREIYICDHFCIYAFAEKLYIACPYTTFDGTPYGIYMIPSVMRNIVEENRKFYPIVMQVLENLKKNTSLLFLLPENGIPGWEEWIEENKNVNKIDKSFEKEISNL